MNIRCPSCQTMFRVDPSRIPAAGIRARCSRCSNTFHITADGSASAAPAAPAGPPPATAAPASDAAPPPVSQAAAPEARAGVAPPEPAAAPIAPELPTPSLAPAPGTPAGGPAGSAQPLRPLPPPPSAAPPREPEPAPAPARPPVFGSRDPNSRAQRIARALVSDIVAYHPKRREEYLAAGTLRTEFREEIMKSWEEYVAQVGLDMAKSTPYFRDALNAILAKGQNVF